MASPQTTGREIACTGLLASAHCSNGQLVVNVDDGRARGIAGASDTTLNCAGVRKYPLIAGVSVAAPAAAVATYGLSFLRRIASSRAFRARRPPALASASKRKRRDTTSPAATYTPSWSAFVPGGRLTPARLDELSVNPVLAGAGFLQCSFGVPDGCGGVTEEHGGHCPPAGSER
jgi:hypothetical protein